MFQAFHKDITICSDIMATASLHHFHTAGLKLSLRARAGDLEWKQHTSGVHGWNVVETVEALAELEWSQSSVNKSVIKAIKTAN